MKFPPLPSGLQDYLASFKCGWMAQKQNWENDPRRFARGCGEYLWPMWKRGYREAALGWKKQVCIERVQRELLEAVGIINEMNFS